MISTEDTQDAVRKMKEEAQESRPVSRGRTPKPPLAVAWFADLCLIVLFLALTFLLGVFPLKDADFYWHLRTGDLIRQTGQVPRTDIFTFTREGTPWIDLHWVFQIAISWVYEHGGVVALNLAKCGITCVAMLLLVTARRRDWPVWVMVLAWLPAILVLGGRMYVRPETLSLLYLSIFLAVVTLWDRLPALALILPLVQVAWVNSQGLFVLGPIVLIFGLIGAVLRPGAFAPERKGWWRTIGIASIATLAACLVNPYGITGVLYPVQLAVTMSNPVFAKHIAELTPIPDFIRQAGFRNLPLQLHLATMALGALSFLVPLGWVVGVHLFGARPATGRVRQGEPDRERSGSATGTKGKRETRSKPARRKGAKPGRPADGQPDGAAGWRLSPFRLLLFAAFSFLSLQATRNSHQFAAVVGSVTAWNFGEWAAALRRRRAILLEPGSAPTRPSTALTPRLVAGSAIAVVLLWVGSGWFYEMTGEKRTIGLGEEPLWFPHAAAQFAGRPEMPERFLSFHNAHASLFEYYHGPQRKVYTDPRLEVAGADLFERYRKLQDRIVTDEYESGWEAELNTMGRPVILVDHEYNAPLGATLLRSTHWRCVWFDAIAAVFVHDTATEAVREHAVDFAVRHFRTDPSIEPRGIPDRSALAKAIRNYVTRIPSYRGELIRPLVWLGLDVAWRILREVPDSIDGWKMLGQIELCREREATKYPSQRYRLPYDPVFDLSIVRATYALRRALELSPDDFTTLLSLIEAYEVRLMYEAELPLLEQIVAIRPLNLSQLAAQGQAESGRQDCLRKLGTPVPTRWRNLTELDQIVTKLLAVGRAKSAAELLEGANPPERATWEVLDRVATLRLHLGEPARARAHWQQAASVADPSIAMARVAATYLVEGDFEAARRAYQQALESKPDLFEACYSLAVLEQDAGNATTAYELALKAMGMAPSDVSRAAASLVASGVARYAQIRGAGGGGRGAGKSETP